VVRALVEAHGEDVEAMARDRKRNAYQHTSSKLRVMVAAYNAQLRGDSSRLFKVPGRG
jgi:nucleolar protein 16